MATPTHETARTHYLQALLARYGTIVMPISSREQKIALNSVFQPLALSQRSLLALKDERESQAQAGPQQGATNQPAPEEPVQARDGSEALEKSPSRRLLILGGPGMGKTTLLKALLQKAIAMALAEPTAPLPLFLSLPDLARSGETLTNYLPHILAALGIESAFATELRSAITNGRAFLCLDSLDEVLPAQRPDVIALINQHAPQYGGTWIVGSRFTEYQGGQFSGGRFVEWELLPLDEALRRQLAEHLLPLLGELFQKPALSSEAFLRDLAHDRRIAEWGENPLLFSLAAIVYARHEMLPASRAALYATIIDAILGQRFPDPAARTVLRRQLVRLSLDLYQTKGRNFSLQDLQALLATYGDTHNASERYQRLAQILDSGVLDVVSHQTYGFKHQMFQEYLAAVALAEQLLDPDGQVAQSAWDFIQRKSTYSRWREILCLLVGVLVQEHGTSGCQIAANWLQHLASAHTSEEGDPGQFHLLLALSSLQEFPSSGYSARLAQAIRELLVTWAETVVGTLLRGAAAYENEIDPEDHERVDADRIFQRLKQAVEHIQWLDLSLVLPALSAMEQALERAKTQDIKTSEEGMVEYFLSNFVLAIPARVLALAFPEPEKVHLFTIVTLKKLDVAVAIEDLLALVENPREQWQARAGAARLLGMTTDTAAQLLLCRILADPTCFSDLRVAAAEALGWMGGALSATTLAQFVQDRDEWVRSAAVRAMSDLGLDMPVQTLLVALRDTAYHVRDAATKTLKLLDERASLEPLLLALRDENKTLRVSILVILSAIQEKSARVPIEAVIHFLHDTNDDIHRLFERTIVIRMLGHFVEERAVLLLLEIMHAPPPYKSRHFETHGRSEAPGAVAVVALLQVSQKIPNIQRWVTVDHAEQALQEDFFSYYRLLELVYTLRMPLSASTRKTFAERYLDDLAHGLYDIEPQKKLQYLLGIGIDVDSLVTSLLDLLHASLFTAWKPARALLFLYRYVPSEPVVAWLAHTDNTAGDARRNRLSARSKDTLVSLLELLVRQGKEIDLESLLDLLKRGDGYFNSIEADRVAEGITRICTLPGFKAPVGHMFGLLCDDAHTEMSIHVLSSLYEQLTPQIIYTEAVHRHADEIMAVAVLGAMQKEAPVELFMAILQDEARDKRFRSQALCELHKLGVVLPLEAFLLGMDWSDEGVADAMVETMTSLGAEAPVTELIKLLGDTDYRVRRGAQRALRNLAHYVPVDLLRTALRSRDEDVRAGVANILIAFGTRTPIEDLLTMMHDKQKAVRAAALQALVSAGFRVPVELLLTQFQDSYHDLHQAAFSALKAMGREAPLEDLLPLLDDRGLSRDTLDVFGTMEDRAPVALLLTLINSEETERLDRLHAARALAKLGKYAPVAEMLARLYAQDGEMRWELIEAFGNLGDDAPIDVIMRALDSDVPETRTAAYRALFTLAEMSPARLVAEARHDPRPLVRKHVLAAVAKLGQDAPLEIALAALDDEETRADALATLQELDVDFPALLSKDRLLEILQARDEAHELRWQERELLEQFGEQIPVALLLSELGGGSRAIADKLYKRYPAVFREVVAPQAEAILRGEPVAGIFASIVQSRIAKAIGQIGRATPEVLNMLVDLLDWPYRETRLEAVRALGAIHRTIPDRAIRRLLQLRRDPQSSELRRAADIALAEILAYENGMEDET